MRADSRGSGPRRGSVLVIVMVTLLFATFALLAFMEKASVDLLVEQREAVSRRLRTEAYSALEVTLAVLDNFREVGNGLRSPAEGWGDPLVFAGYVPADDRQVEVAFEDESGKISLPRANATVLTALFINWGVAKNEAETLADALLGWMKRGHVYSTSVSPGYDRGTLPYDVPGRPLRSYHELAAIEQARDFFYDRDGRPNDYWRRFADSVSLFDFRQPNLNGAKPDTLAALGQFDPLQQEKLGEYLRGAGSYRYSGPGYFQAPKDAQAVAGPAGDTSGFATTISALRITVTVRDGRTVFRTSAVIAVPPNGATSVQETATSTRVQASAASAQSSTQQQNRPNAMAPAPAADAGKSPATAPRSLRYPFTLLEIRENDAIPAPPAASNTTLN